MEEEEEKKRKSNTHHSCTHDEQMPSPKAEGHDTDVLTTTQAQTRVVELESDVMRLEAELRDARHTIDRFERGGGGSPQDRKRKPSISGSTAASALAHAPSANGTTPPTPALDELLPSHATTPVAAAAPTKALFFTGPVDSETFGRFVRRVVALYEPTSSADAAQQRWAGKELEGLLHYVRVHNLTYPAVSDLCHESTSDEGFARTPMHADAHRYGASPAGGGGGHAPVGSALQTRPTAFRSASSSPHQRRTGNHATPRRVKQHHTHHSSHHSHSNHTQHRTASPPLVFRSTSPVSQQRTVSPPVARRVVGPAVATAISRMVPMDGPAPSYGDATRASQSPSSSPAPQAPATSGDHAAAPARTVSPQSVRRRSGTQPFPSHLGKRPSSGSYSRNSSKALSGAPPPPQRPPPSPRRADSKSFSAVPVRSRSRSTSPEKRQAERQLQHLRAQQEEQEGHPPAVATLAAKTRVVSVSVPELLIREDQEREKACRDRAARIRWPQTQGMPAQS